MSLAVNAYAALGLSDDEYRRILDLLGREPTPTELAMFSVEWSEHCGYPRSRTHLAKFPQEGHFKPLVGTDAGGIEVNGSLVLFKMESHNHPSQVEPQAGAATGVGGIIRDIVSMGARPIALLDSLKFGAADDPTTAFYVKGVVAGIAAYGNCIGIPTVGGEVLFDKAYGGNCLVNVMCVGVLEPSQLMTSQARPGGSVMYLGPRTGRDGIGGCSVLASKEFGSDDSKRPNVQIGDPFSGKCLMEATLEAIRSGALISLKDMGAAGLTCTTAEMADAGGCGMDVDLAHVPRREDGMAPYEVMMSESQERMLAVVHPGREAEVAAIFNRWGLPAAVLGKTTEGGELVIRDREQVVARLPVRALTHPQPILLPQAPVAALPQLPVPATTDPAADLLALLRSPNISSRRWIFRQYDHMVQTSTVVRPGDGDAAVIRMPDGKTGLAAVMDSCPRYARLDPFEGARHAVAEACRNLSCVGAEPAGITDGLNFGNPEKPDRFWQLVRSIEGLAAACRELGLPVVSGNVSLYNESPNGPILPTAIVGAVGVLPDVRRTVGAGFQHDDDWIVLLEGATPQTMCGSEYADRHRVPLQGQPPTLDLQAEMAVQAAARDGIRRGLVQSAHDTSDGGLAVALAEACLLGGRGAKVEVGGTDCTLSWFGEAPARIVVTCRPEHLDILRATWSIPYRVLGRTGGKALRIDGLSIDMGELRRAWESLPEILGL